jgi:hypothetical protein
MHQKLKFISIKNFKFKTFHKFKVSFGPSAWVYLSSYGDCSDYMEVDLGGGVYSDVHGSTGLSTGLWYHVAFVHSGTNFTIYVNGAVSGGLSNAVSSSSMNTTRLYNYFGYSQNGNCGDVLLDEIKLYNKALTQSQIQLDMNTVGIPSGIC